MTSSKPSTVRDEGTSISSQLSTPVLDFGESEEKRIRRKPNFTIQERMHLAQSYVESYEEYNRGFTPTTKGEAKIGRQRLLERWAAELSSFGIVERTPVEVEQKIRDYMKKIAANRKRAVKRAMSPPCQLISSVVSESSTVDDSTTDDSLTAYAGFLLEQHKASQSDCAENFEPLGLINNKCDIEEPKSGTNNAPIFCFESTSNLGNSCRKRKTSGMNLLLDEKEQLIESSDVVPPPPELHKQQMEFDSVDLAMKTVYIEIARKELEKKTIEVETMKTDLEIRKLELEEKRHDVEKKRLELRKLQRSFIRNSLPTNSREGNGITRNTSPSSILS